MILSTSAIAWASVRSGLGLGDFLASLTPEKEAAILAAYNEWRRSKGLAEDKPLAPLPPLRPAVQPAPSPSEGEEAPSETREDDLADLIHHVAEEVEEEEAAEAEAVAETMEQINSMAIDAEELPEEVMRELEASESDGGEDAPAEPAPAPAPAARAPGDSIAEAIPDEGTVPERFAAVARRLPKEPDPALYAQILERLGDREALRAAAQSARDEYHRKHRGTAPLRAFLDWLDTDC